MEKEFSPALFQPCRCGRRGRVCEYRCGDCAAPPMLCAQCLVTSHASEPFHWAEKWNGSFFEQIDMSTIGLEVCLGHDGLRCPAAIGDQPIKVIDINGFHDVRVVFCDCLEKEHEPVCIQLVRYGLFPATVKNPEVAFTFRCMEDFHLHTLTSRKTAFDYIKKLGRRTDEFTRTFTTVSVECIVIGCDSPA